LIDQGDELSDINWLYRPARGNGDRKLNTRIGEDMVVSVMVADFNAISGCHGNQGINPPIARVFPHLFELLFRSAHGDMILDMILHVNPDTLNIAEFSTIYSHIVVG
jgi:hypothetical protein